MSRMDRKTEEVVRHSSRLVQGELGDIRKGSVEARRRKDGVKTGKVS